MASFNRMRLIAYKTPFIVPDFLIDLREHFTRLRWKSGENMTPSAQAVLLYCIINRKYGPMTNGEVSEKMKYSRMTLNRAFDELESFELAKNKAQGRNQRLIGKKHDNRKLLILFRCFFPCGMSMTRGFSASWKILWRDSNGNSP